MGKQWPLWLSRWICWSAIGWTGVAGAAAPDNPAQICQLDALLRAANPGRVVALDLTGVVLWAGRAESRLVLAQEGQIGLLELNWEGAAPAPGRVVRIRGRVLAQQRGDWVRLGPVGPVVDNDGVHAFKTKSGAVYLEAGRHPVRLEWFNARDEARLEVEWCGPNQAPAAVPAEALFRLKGPDKSEVWEPGLSFQAFEAEGESLPDWSRARLLQEGTCDVWDVRRAPRTERVALVFHGFLHVPRSGLWTFTVGSDDGSRLFVGNPTLAVELLGWQDLPRPVHLLPGQPWAAAQAVWACTEGIVTWAATDDERLNLEVSGGGSRMQATVTPRGTTRAEDWTGRRARLCGVCLPVVGADGVAAAGRWLVPGLEHLEPAGQTHEQGAETGPGGLPVLRTAAAVHGLSRQAAQRQYPVQMEGTVTCVLPEHQAVVVHDATRGLYVVDESGQGAGLPRAGEWVRVEGITDPGLFAPMVQARRLEIRGLGRWPEPVRPAWEQLLNGSLDAQWIELEGVVTAVHSNRVSLLLREGLLDVELRVPGLLPEQFRQFEDALVRIRGCLFATWDYQTHQVRAGSIRLYGAEVHVEQPPPRDWFDRPLKTAAALRLFDPAAGLFQRVRVSGQLLHRSGRELFLSENGAGFRAWLKTDTPGLEPGDWLEVVGFPDLSVRSSPVLREARVRSTGQRAPLPEPWPLPEQEWNPAQLDARRVQAEGVLVERRRAEDGRVFELQRGLRLLAIRWDRPDPPPEPALGSRVRVTGVCAVHPVRPASALEAGSFQVLVGPADQFLILARPPFWTLERLLGLMGALAGVLFLATLWITQLHRQVERRGAALEREIRARQRLEQQQALEQERARVARDLHDELGSDLTEIAMLLDRARAPQTRPERRNEYLEQAAATARQMVTALDEIVWAMNPRHDTLGSLISYLCLHAERFLGAAGIAWRLEETQAPADLPVDSPRRHHLFLAFKEALTNVVRHAGATEVRFRLDAGPDHLCLTVQDNGRGLPAASAEPGMDGLENLRARCEKLGGRFQIETAPGQGTTLRFWLPRLASS
ncbi:MAG: ATP-binding protein [Limisphaera sp.]